jgi:hypothetical protein
MVATALILLLVLIVVAFVPLTVSVFAYAYVEKRTRRAWSGMPLAAGRTGGGPYRDAEIPRSRLERAPLFVRAAAVGCFYWSWFCLLTWIALGIFATQRLALLPVVLAGVTMAALVARTGGRLLRRDPRVVASGRRLALGVALHSTLVVVLATLLGGDDWSGPANVFALVSLGHAALLVKALREHANLFQVGHDDKPATPALPAWLARMLLRRAQRRANFAVSASHTRAGA